MESKRIIAEELGLGALLDVSSSSNPRLFEYCNDDVSYTKYNYDSLKNLAGNDFIFHKLDDNKELVFLNNQIIFIIEAYPQGPAPVYYIINCS